MDLAARATGRAPIYREGPASDRRAFFVGRRTLEPRGPRAL